MKANVMLFKPSGKWYDTIELDVSTYNSEKELWATYLQIQLWEQHKIKCIHPHFRNRDT